MRHIALEQLDLMDAGHRTFAPEDNWEKTIGCAQVTVLLVVQVRLSSNIQTEHAGKCMSIFR